MTELKDRVEEVLKIYNEYENSPTEIGMRFVVWHELKNNAVEMGGVIKDQQSRIEELETLVSDIYEDLKMRAQFTEDPKVLDISNGIFMRMAEVLESIKGE